MHFAIICRILGLLLMVFSITLLAPCAIAVIYNDGTLGTFLLSFFVIFISGLLLWMPTYRARDEPHSRDGFLITSLFWVVLGFFGALPLIISDATNMSLTDAVFESISGLTTTGATMLSGLDTMPQAILFYRQMLHWLGGIGVIVIALAVLPMLGVGGMQLFKAETPGPSKDKLTPRITETAKALFLAYFVMTLACALTLWLLGMSLFDAVCYTFTIVGTGGFGNHDASLGFFTNPWIHIAAAIFMLLSGLNFALLYIAISRRTVKHYLLDEETRFFLRVVFASIALLTIYLTLSSAYELLPAFSSALFHVSSVITTTGLVTDGFSHWPTFAPVFLICLSFIGGCAGSTSGGIKSIRSLIAFKHGFREMAQLAHPNAIIPLKVGRRRVEAKVISAVWGFIAVYAWVTMTLMLLIMATGEDFLTAFSAVTACLNNMGIGLGKVSTTFSALSDTAKWLLSFAMLLGRLEVFTLLVLFTPMFWRR